MKLKLPVSRFPRQFDPEVLEMMDRPDPNPALLEEDLLNIRRINRWLGAHRLVHAELEHMFKDGKPQTLLDLCTGSGDLPRLIVCWCRARGISIKITATDLNPLMLATAAKQSVEFPEITFETVDALRPQYGDGSFDWVMCHLALHHFSVEQAVDVLRQMWRIARMGVLVNDLNRQCILCILAKTWIPMLSANPMTRFDAVLSTRRAFTVNEMQRLAFHAGIEGTKSRRYFLGRQILMAHKPPGVQI